MLPAWTRALFSLSVVRRESADRSKLIQDSFHNYVVNATTATTWWTQKVHL